MAMRYIKKADKVLRVEHDSPLLEGAEEVSFRDWIDNQSDDVLFDGNLANISDISKEEWRMWEEMREEVLTLRKQANEKPSEEAPSEDGGDESEGGSEEVSEDKEDGSVEAEEAKAEDSVSADSGEEPKEEAPEPQAVEEKPTE